MNLSRPEAEQQFLEVHVDNQVRGSIQKDEQGEGNLFDEILKNKKSQWSI